MIDFAIELFDSLARHGVRTVLTLLSVAWGSFVLVLLLGAGEGLSNSVSQDFKDDARNSLWLWRGDTSRPWQGLPVGRRVQFHNGDLEAFRREIPEIEHISGRFVTSWGGQRVTGGGRSGDFDLRSVHPDHRFLEQTIIVAGRWLDDLDLAERRKVAVIGEPVAETLFRGDQPLGQWIGVGGVQFQVVGLFRDEGDDGEARMVYLPVTTAQAAFGGYDRLTHLMFDIGDATVDDALRIEDEARALLARLRRFDPSDPRAVRIRNNVELYSQVTRLLGLLRGFVWLIGLGTMASGLVGVSNILLVSVRERTAEFGLRKALGATPASIVRSVVAEAVLMTGVAGYGGIVAAVGALGLWNWAAPENEYVRDPSVELGPAAVAAVVLVVAGAIAGAAPAVRAASISPVDALRDGG